MNSIAPEEKKWVVTFHFTDCLHRLLCNRQQILIPWKTFNKDYLIQLPKLPTIVPLLNSKSNAALLTNN